MKIKGIVGGEDLTCSNLPREQRYPFLEQVKQDHLERCSKCLRDFVSNAKTI